MGVENRSSYQYLNSGTWPLPQSVKLLHHNVWSLALWKPSGGPEDPDCPPGPDELCLFISLAAWSWPWWCQSLPAGVLTWLHLLKLSTCCNSEDVGDQKQCCLCSSFNLSHTTKMSTLTPNAREGDLSINMKHPLNRYQIQPTVITLRNIQWSPMALFPMIHFPWWRALVTTQTHCEKLRGVSVRSCLADEERMMKGS